MSSKVHSKFGEKAISAHKCGAEGDRDRENKASAVLEAIEQGFEFLEFDVQLLGDDTMVIFHDSSVEIDGRSTPLITMNLEECREAIPGLLIYEEILRLMEGKAKAHIDFKFRSPQHLYKTPWSTLEVRATKLAMEILGVENIIVTTMEDDSIKAVRSTLGIEYPELLVGLSLGRSLTNMSLIEQRKLRMEELMPLERLTACDANLIVASKKVYGPGVIAASHALRAPILLWTVDDEEEMWNYLTDVNIWLITTNHPATMREIWDSIYAK